MGDGGLFVVHLSVNEVSPQGEMMGLAAKTSVEFA